MKTLGGLVILAVLLVGTVQSLPAELIGAASASEKSFEWAEWSDDGSAASWQDELRRWFQGAPGAEGELMAVVLPPGAVRPRPPVVPPPTGGPADSPPEIAIGAGRGDVDSDQAGERPPTAVPPIPEPGSMALLAVGAAGLAGYGGLRRRRRK